MSAAPTDLSLRDLSLRDLSLIDRSLTGSSPTSLAARLDETTRRVLEFERGAGWRGRSKERTIRERLGITPTRYHQLLVAALDTPEALAFDPALVRRLRRLRDTRRRSRFAARLGLAAPPG